MRPIIIFILLLSLSGCAGYSLVDEHELASQGHTNKSYAAGAVPKYEPYSKYGNPDSYVVFGKTYHVKKSAKGYVGRGIASWYGTKFHGKRTSSGETYDMHQMTAAHKSLPLPTYAEVTNLDNGRTITVKINDRGPFKEGRIIDLSYSAAIKLGIDKKGTGNVEVRAITISPDGKKSVAKASPTLPKTAPLQDPVTDPQIYLQLGSFGERDNMQRMLNQLLDSNVDNVVIQQPSDASPFYRLRVGPLASRNSADQLVTKFKQMGFEKPYVVVD